MTTENIGRIVKSSADYEIILVAGKEGFDVEYGVRNTTYDVLETQTPLLPQALEYLDQLQSGVDAHRDMADAEAEASIVVDSAIGKAATH